MKAMGCSLLVSMASLICLILLPVIFREYLDCNSEFIINVTSHVIVSERSSTKFNF
jgi:hypothetical protein